MNASPATRTKGFESSLNAFFAPIGMAITPWIVLTTICAVFKAPIPTWEWLPTTVAAGIILFVKMVQAITSGNGLMTGIFGVLFIAACTYASYLCPLTNNIPWYGTIFGFVSAGIIILFGTHAVSEGTRAAAHAVKKHYQK